MASFGGRLSQSGVRFRVVFVSFLAGVRGRSVKGSVWELGYHSRFVWDSLGVVWGLSLDLLGGEVAKTRKTQAGSGVPGLSIRVGIKVSWTVYIYIYIHIYIYIYIYIYMNETIFCTYKKYKSAIPPI